MSFRTFLRSRGRKPATKVLMTLISLIRNRRDRLWQWRKEIVSSRKRQVRPQETVEERRVLHLNIISKLWHKIKSRPSTILL